MVEDYRNITDRNERNNDVCKLELYRPDKQQACVVISNFIPSFGQT